MKFRFSSNGKLKGVRCTLPFPVSTNTFYRNFNGRMVISKRGRDFKSEVEKLIQAERGEHGVPLFGKDLVSLDMVLHPPDKRRRDIDNFSGKSILDSLIGLVYEDDSQVKKLSVEFGEVRKGGELLLDCKLYETQNCTV